MKAWLLFLSSNDYYLYLTLSVYQDLLSTGTKYPVYCAITRDVNSSTKSILVAAGIKLLNLDNIDILNKSSLDYYKKALPKLAILNLKDFDKIVYLDSDLWIKENIDELFDKPHMTAVINRSPQPIINYELSKSVFCSGLFVWDYKVGHPLDLAKLPAHCSWHDQSVLNYFYQDWGKCPELQLDYRYGLMNSLSDGIDLSDVKIMHFVNRNRTDWPFNRTTYEERNHRHFKKWVGHIAKNLEELKQNYNIILPKLHPENIVEYKEEL